MIDFSDAIFLDTETTGKPSKNGGDPPPEVIQLGWIRPFANLGGTQSGVSKLFRPSRPPQFGAIAVHGLTMTDLEGADPSHTASRHLPGSVGYWIGHNIDFDWEVLGRPAVRRICTLAMARDLWPELDSHSLGACLLFALGARPEVVHRLRNAHDATVDCQFAMEVLEAMLKMPRLEGVRSLDELWRFSEECRVPKVFTFGKFEGQPISAADRGYAQWCRKNLKPFDPYLEEAFKREGLL